MILQLPYLDKYNSIREARFERASEKLGTRIYCRDSKNPAFAIPIKADSASHKKKIIGALGVAGIASRPVVSGSMGLQPFWVRRFGETITPNSKNVDECGFYVTNDPQLHEAKFEFLLENLGRAML